MWTEHQGQLPGALATVGLGAEPVYSHADRSWYLRQDVGVGAYRVLRYGLGALDDAPLQTNAGALLAYLQANGCTQAVFAECSTFQPSSQRSRRYTVDPN